MAEVVLYEPQVVAFVGLVTAKVCEMAKCTISFGDARRLVLATSM
jgi:hypothetical protein